MQQFAADAVQNTGTQAVTNGTPLQVVIGNLIAIGAGLAAPPGSFKVKVEGQANITFGTTSTSVRVQVFRNPTAENVLVADSGIITRGVAAGVLDSIGINGLDTIADGRDVAYAVVVTIQGTGAPSVTRAYIEATVLQ